MPISPPIAPAPRIACFIAAPPQRLYDTGAPSFRLLWRKGGKRVLTELPPSRLVMQRSCAYDRTTVVILHQHRDFEIGGVPARMWSDLDGLLKRSVLHAPQFPQLPHDRRMLQGPAALFSPPEIAVVSPSSVTARKTWACVFSGACTAIFKWSPASHCSDTLRGFRLGRRQLKVVLQSCDIVAETLQMAVDYHLRGVRVRHMKMAFIIALPLGELRRGEAVAPSIMVPVVNVLAQEDEVHAGRSLLAQLDQERVGRRATGASLRGEQLNHDRSLRPGARGEQPNEEAISRREALFMTKDKTRDKWFWFR